MFLVMQAVEGKESLIKVGDEAITFSQENSYYKVLEEIPNLSKFLHDTISHTHATTSDPTLKALKLQFVKKAQ